MKHYTFEHTDSRFLLILIGVFFALLIALLACMQYLIPVFGQNIGFVLIVGIPAVVVWLFRGRLKKFVLADLNSSSVKFDFGDRVETIAFHDIKSYKIEHYNGTTLTLKFADRKKISITANANFCNPTQFELFCHDLEELILKNNAESGLEVVRIGSVFEQKWMLPFLIIATAGIAWVFIHSFATGKGFPKSIYTSIAIFIGLWIAYFRARQKK